MTTHRILFIRNVVRPTGGNIKLRDYFGHALNHPGLDAHIWFPPGSRHELCEIWTDVPRDRVIRGPDLSLCDLGAYRFVCVNGKDWGLLPEGFVGPEIIHFVQHGGYAQDPVLRRYLTRPAHRLCVSAFVRNTIAPYADGPLTIIPPAIDPIFFGQEAVPEHVVILGRKQKAMALAVRDRLRACGIEASVILDDWMARPSYARAVRHADIVVALPHAEEGFFLPALEAMAARCVVVCSDVHGNRGYCIAEQTCLQPPHGDVGAHADAVLRALADAPLRARLRANGLRMARRHTPEAERTAFHAFVATALRTSLSEHALH